MIMKIQFNITNSDIIKEKIYQIYIIQPRMLSKKQFQPLYTQCVVKIGQIKTINDKVNKAIGIVNDDVVSREIDKDDPFVKELCKKVEENLIKMEKSYLDPGAIRKIGVVRQQLGLQRDRRQQLKASIDKLITNSKKEQKILNKKRQSENKGMIVRLSNETVKQKESLLTDNIEPNLQKKLINQRKQQFTEISKKLWNVNYVTKEIANYVQVNGQKIDIINQNIYTSGENMELTHLRMDHSRITYKKRVIKYIVLSIILLIAIGMVIYFVFIV